MVHFQNHAWQILEKCEKLVGFWPYQRRVKNYAVPIGISLLILTYNIPLVLRIIKEWNTNFYIILENSLAIAIIFVVITKIFCANLLKNKRQRILEQVASHFETIDDEEEAQILSNHSNKGLKAIITYAAITIGCCVIFNGLPIMRMCFSYFFGEGKLEKKIPLHVDFHVDEQEYFYYILAHMLISLGAGMIADYTYDLTFFLAVRHVCALFEIVELRMKRALEIFQQFDENKKLIDSDEDKAYKIISTAVDLHNEALQLARILDEVYNVTWFVSLLLNMFFLGPVVLFVLFYMNNPFELCRYIVILILILSHFYVIFLHGQLIIDFSSSVFISCYDSSWYIAPKRTKFIFLIMMRQSSSPRQLTGGKVFVLSMETFGKMLKTGLSFITLFAALEY